MCRAGRGVRVLAGEASAHKGLPFIAFEFLCAGFFVTHFHLVLLTLSCSLHSFSGFAERHVFINAFRSSPFPSPNPFALASALQVFILFY